jgi:Fic family protein
MTFDRNETIDLMEPLLISSDSSCREQLTDLAFELMASSTRFKSSLPSGLLEGLADLVRSMNCYYSNLIEDHNTHPVDIERALNNDFSNDPHKRDLQLEAKAHIEVQRWIDEGAHHHRYYSREFICEIHQKFCVNLPEELLWVQGLDSEKKIKIIPGETRTKDVKVGRHYAVSPGAVSRFLTRYEEVYSSLSKSEAIISAAAAHHRLLWIHPFLDGNGRVARLVSHAALSDLLDTGSVWSVARGLAKNEGAYKQHLMDCDKSREGDLDGRGNLSMRALNEFSRFFLETCLDQVKFMEDLMKPDHIRNRILVWVKEEMHAKRLPEKSDALIQAVLFRGELPRGQLSEVLGTSDRSARRIASSLVKHKVLTSKSTRAPLKLFFHAEYADRWMPGLFPKN